MSPTNEIGAMDQVREAFVRGLLNRGPDPGGFAHHVQITDPLSAETMAGLIRAFATSNALDELVVRRLIRQYAINF